MEEGLLHRLRELEFFRELPADWFQSVGDELSVLRCHRGDIVFGQGDAPDAVFAILDGTVEISVDLEGGATRAISEIGPGTLFGEIGLLTGEVRNATARVKARRPRREVSVKRIPAVAFGA